MTASRSRSFLRSWYTSTIADRPCHWQRGQDDLSPTSRPLVLCLRESGRRERSSRSMSSLRWWSSSARWLRRCRARKRRFCYYRVLRLQQLTTSVSRPAIAIQTMSRRNTIYARERRQCPVQRGQYDLSPMSRQTVPCQRESDPRGIASRSMSSLRSWLCSPRWHYRCRGQRRPLG